MKYRRQDGFTLIELAVVIVIIAILAAITIFTYSRIQSNQRDAARESQITAIAGALEKYYNEHGEYPGCSAMTAAGSSVSSLLENLEPTIFVAPTASGGTTNSISTCNDLTTSSGDTFAYVGDGTTACNSGSACTMYELQYKQESTGEIITVVGQHQAAAAPVNAPTAPTVSATMSGTSAKGTLTAVTCTVGTPQYRFSTYSRNTTASPSWSSYGSWSTDTEHTIGSTSQGYQYGFKAQARCNDNGNYSDASGDSNVDTTVRSISKPSAPTYLSPASFKSNVSATVNYSSSCPSGTSLANGQFRTRAWTGGTWGPHPFGYLDSWENYTGSNKNVEYWGKYRCKTPFHTSSYSNESYNVIVVKP